MSNHYLLIINDRIRPSGNRLSAIVVCKALLEQQVWPLYHRTPNCNAIKAGDTCLVYIAGNGVSAQHVIAKVKIENNVVWNSRIHRYPYADLEIQKPTKAIELEKPMMLTEPVHIPSIIETLDLGLKTDGSFNKKWGWKLGAGTRRISLRDYTTILSQ